MKTTHQRKSHSVDKYRIYHQGFVYLLIFIRATSYARIETSQNSPCLQVNLKVPLERRYIDWLNGQGYSKSCENLDEKSQDREKIAAVIENLVQCAEPFIEDEGGEFFTTTKNSCLSQKQ